MRPIEKHIASLKACRLCPEMRSLPVACRPIDSRILLIGQAPGIKEPEMGKPFAWTAGKTLFKWLHAATGWDEEEVRAKIFISSVCRCYPGKNPKGGDRVPSDREIKNCSRWMLGEIRLLEPALVIPVGKLAIRQFIEFDKLTEVIGRPLRLEIGGVTSDYIALPHPSGASTWHRMEPGKSLVNRAIGLISRHAAIAASRV